MHHFARLAGFHDQRHLCTGLFPNEMIVHRSQRQQTRDRGVLFIDTTIGENDNRVPGFYRQRRTAAEAI